MRSYNYKCAYKKIPRFLNKYNFNEKKFSSLSCDLKWNWVKFCFEKKTIWKNWRANATNSKKYRKIKVNNQLELLKNFREKTESLKENISKIKNINEKIVWLET